MVDKRQIGYDRGDIIIIGTTSFFGEHQCFLQKLFRFDVPILDSQVVILLASVPLTEEDWVPLPEYTILAIRHGEVVAQA